MTGSPQGTNTAPSGGSSWLRRARGALLWAVFGALLIVVLSQIPARHDVDIGSNDSAYTQGFYDPEPSGAADLVSSDGSARWTKAASALLFPQAGLPGNVRLHLRAPSGTETTELVVLLNGSSELARFRIGAAWSEVAVPLQAGRLKASDFFIELRTQTKALPDGREVGVLVDRASYTVGPGLTVPALPQLIYVALVGILLWLLTSKRQWRLTLAGVLGYGALWLFLYRLQPPFYPYPLRALPLWTMAGLAALLALRDGPALATRWPRLVDSVGPLGVIAGWTTLTLMTARAHVTLSRPGVENDFRVFATRETLGQVFSADGFYNLGYPLLLWLVRPLYAGNAFLAGRLVAALAGVVLLAACYWLARSLLPSGAALVALISLALSALVAQYGLYVGSDMPFAACVTLCVAALVGIQHTGYRLQGAETSSKPLWLIGLAGAFGGMAFLMRHLGLVLLPWGLVVLLAQGSRGRRAALTFTLGFLLTMAPQVVINMAQVGQPLYNQQAKNIWLAVYGGTDWGRWEEAPNSIGLAEVVLRDPARFLANWWGNVVAYLGSGAEDTSEFGRAIQLRLLGFPANWLALGGLLVWMAGLVRQGHQPAHPAGRALLLLVALYVTAVSTAFSLPRFFLPLAPIYAVALGWLAWRLTSGGRALLALTLALVVVLWGGLSAGFSYVLTHQPPDEIAIIQLVEATGEPTALLAARVSSRLPVAKYSAIAHRVVAWPTGADAERPLSAADLDAARTAGASYLIWDETTGPPPLVNPAAARVSAEGRYALYRIDE